MEIMEKGGLSLRSLRGRYPNIWACAAVLVIVLFTVFVRVRLLDIPLERDEGEYAYTARLILEGIPPYTESYDLKMPCIRGLYGGLRQ
jgi:hypothetical protein